MIDCGELTANSCSVLSQGESVKYFLDNLDKLSDPVSCFCPRLLVQTCRLSATPYRTTQTHTHKHELAQQQQVMLPFFFSSKSLKTAKPNLCLFLYAFCFILFVHNQCFLLMLLLKPTSGKKALFDVIKGTIRGVTTPLAWCRSIL